MCFFPGCLWWCGEVFWGKPQDNTTLRVLSCLCSVCESLQGKLESTHSPAYFPSRCPPPEMFVAWLLCRGLFGLGRQIWVITLALLRLRAFRALIPWWFISSMKPCLVLSKKDKATGYLLGAGEMPHSSMLPSIDCWPIQTRWRA